jgi:hypothetical protein
VGEEESPSWVFPASPRPCVRQGPSRSRQSPGPGPGMNADGVALSPKPALSVVERAARNAKKRGDADLPLAILASLREVSLRILAPPRSPAARSESRRPFGVPHSCGLRSCLSLPPTFVCFVTFVVKPQSGAVRRQDLFSRCAPRRARSRAKGSPRQSARTYLAPSRKGRVDSQSTRLLFVVTP